MSSAVRSVNDYLLILFFSVGFPGVHSQNELTQTHEEIKVNHSIKREMRSAGADVDGAGSPCYLEDRNGDMDLNRPRRQNAEEDGAGSPCYLEDENGDMDLNRPQVCKIIHFRLTSFHLTRNC